MAFQWKSHSEIFKGEGIYHLTFTVAGRRPLFGSLVPLEESRAYSRGYFGSVKRSQDNVRNNEATSQYLAHSAKYTSKIATTELSAFGFAVLKHLMELRNRYDEGAVVICGKQFMPDHLHVVIWIKADLEKSIRQIAQGFRIGIKKIAVEMSVWNDSDGHILDIPFIRTLSHKGQLETMISYLHANPDNAWMRRLHPDMYTIRRKQEYAGLLFDMMGKARLLDWADKRVVALSRSLTPEMIDAEINKALYFAERGFLTMTAAINEGERAVAKAIREAGFPLVVMLLDGFPQENSEQARYYHPHGVYHTLCSEGRLLLMAPHQSNYENPRVIAATDDALRQKAESKHLTYSPIPHSSTRWRMVAGNEMLKIVKKEDL